MSKDVKAYTNNHIKVTFDKSLCTHSANCVKGLPDVFDTSKRPWINVDGASVDAIVKTVQNCPSAALQYELQNEEQ